MAAISSESLTSDVEKDRRARVVTALADPFAFAIVQWPAVLVALAAPWLALQIVAGVWLLLTVPASYMGNRGAGFGNLMVLLCAFVAGAWWSYPSLWTFAWVPAVMIGLHSAQRARLKRLWPLGE